MDKKQINDNRISKDFKYLALYWNLGFVPNNSGVFEKNYSTYHIDIDTEKGQASIQNTINKQCKTLMLNSHKAFVVLECIDRLLVKNITSIISINTDKTGALTNTFDLEYDNVYIHCVEWEWEMVHELNLESLSSNNCNNIYVSYSSRLYSGLIDYKQFIIYNNQKYNHGLFENNDFTWINDVQIGPFKVECNEIVEYSGTNTIVVIPEGITALHSCLFWDNQTIEELILPSSLQKIGGDLCYNCKNIKRIHIPKSVTTMGDNPFAGCPNLEISNDSNYFVWDGHILYDKLGKLIHCQIKNAPKEVKITDGTKLIGKHAFYMCENIEKIVIPGSIINMQNFPFSGCKNLKSIVMNTNKYTIKDGVVYANNMTELIGCLNTTKTDCLTIPYGVEKIARNSFFKCNGIKKVIIPQTLKSIGYNPFNRCENIEFESKSPSFQVIDGILYNQDVSRLICCPASRSVGKVIIPDSVVELERNAFSGCHKMTEINLKNISKIGKSCFSGCSSLISIHIPDHVSYIGEWAFAYCSQLKEISIYKDTFIDRNATSNTNSKITIRKDRGNYLIKSENLHFLKCGIGGLKEKISTIIIDPPYNSKIPNIGYCDDFGSNYKTFILERLKLAYNLLSDKGFLIICIDRGGLPTIRRIAWQLFGYSRVYTRRWDKLDDKLDINKEIQPNKPKVRFEYIVFCKKKNARYLNKLPFTFSGYGTTSSAKDEIAHIFGDRKAFSTPKPIALFKKIISATTPRNGIVLDFFAGSGTTAIATMEQNKIDNGSRNYILVEENDCANKITEPRIRFYEIEHGGEHYFLE